MKLRKVLILNGPNLNMLGTREPEVYGYQTLRDIEDLCHRTAHGLGMRTDFRQSNHEGELVDWIQEALGLYDAILINAAAYTHTSVAIHDALKMHQIPIVEVHLSNPKKRDKFRRFSFIKPLATEVIVGKGAQGYVEAIEKIHKIVNS